MVGDAEVISALSQATAGGGFGELDRILAEAEREAEGIGWERGKEIQ